MICALRLLRSPAAGATAWVNLAKESSARICALSVRSSSPASWVPALMDGGDLAAPRPARPAPARPAPSTVGRVDLVQQRGGGREEVAELVAARGVGEATPRAPGRARRRSCRRGVEIDTCSAPKRLTGWIVAVDVAGTLNDGSMSSGDLGLVLVQRDGGDPADLHAAEDHGRARVQALAGAGERPAQLVVAGEVAVGQAHERRPSRTRGRRGRPG